MKLTSIPARVAALCYAFLCLVTVSTYTANLGVWRRRGGWPCSLGCTAAFLPAWRDHGQHSLDILPWAAANITVNTISSDIRTVNVSCSGYKKMHCAQQEEEALGMLESLALASSVPCCPPPTHCSAPLGPPQDLHGKAVATEPIYISQLRARYGLYASDAAGKEWVQGVTSVCMWDTSSGHLAPRHMQRPGSTCPLLSLARSTSSHEQPADG